MNRPPQILDHAIEVPRLAKAPRSRFFRPIGLKALLATALLSLGAPIGFAAPKGAKVVTGSASFDRDGNITRIRASDGTIINYSSFNIGKSETVQFLQPNSSSRVLNRIGGGNPTSIFGTIQANGVVYLVNPSGIYFRDGSMVNVGMLYAAAGTISDSDFLTGVNHFSQLGASVINSGAINAARDVSLVGANVANYGTITSQAGTVLMVSGGDVLLGQRDGNVYVNTVSANPKAGTAADTPATAGVTNTGTINAPHAIMGAGDLYSIAISNSGLVKSRDIQLNGGPTGIVNVSGTLDASSQTAGTTGGTVKITGEKIALRAATVDASGPAGGGTVLIGGGPGGSGDTRHASQTIVDAASVIKADATVKGNGGNVVVWSDQYTQFYGTISGKGGPTGGNGGTAEISSAQSLVAKGTVDLSAPMGQLGTLTYDPQNIVIQAGSSDGSDATDTNAGTLKNGTGPQGTVDFADEGTSTPTDFVVTESEITGTAANIILDARNSVTTTGTFSNPVQISDGKNLTIQTRNNAGDASGSFSGIDISAINFKTTSGGTITLKSGAGGASGSAGVIVGSLTSAGSVSITAQGAITQATGTISGSSVTLNAGTSVAINSISSTGLVNITAQTGSLTATNTISGTGLSLSAGTTIGTSASPVNFSGTTLSTLSNGDQYLQNTGSSIPLTSANAGAHVINFSGGTFSLSGTIADASTIQVNTGSTFTINSTETVGGVILNGGLINGSGKLISLTDYDVRGGEIDANLGQGTTAVGLNKTTGAAVTLKGSNTYTGATSISGGTLALGANNVLSNSTNVGITNGSTLDMGGNNDTVASVTLTDGKILGTGTLTSTSAYNVTNGEIDAVLGGSVGLNKIGTGTVLLKGANTYTGVTAISSGTLALGASNVFSDNTSINITNGTANGSTLDLGGNNDTVATVVLTDGRIIGSGTLTAASLAGNAFDVQKGQIDVNLAGNGGLTKSQSGTVILTGSNTYSGATTINAGTLQLGSNNVIADNSTVNVNGGTFDLKGHVDTVGTVTLTGNGSILSSSGTGTLIGASYGVQSGTISVNLGGSGSLIKTTAGTVTLSGSNNYSGTTEIDAGTLVLGKDNTLTGVTDIEIDGGTLSIGQFKNTVAGVTLNSGSITGDVGGLLTSNSAFIIASGTVNATLGGTAGLIKVGNSTAIIKGVTGNAASSVGDVHVNDGVLQWQSSNPFAAGTNFFVNDATGAGSALLDLAGFNQTMASLTLVAPLAGKSTAVNLSGGTLSLGGTLSVVDNTTFAGSGGGAVINGSLNGGPTGVLDLQGQRRDFIVAGQAYSNQYQALTINAPVVNGMMVVTATADPSGHFAVVALGTANTLTQAFKLEVAQGHVLTLVDGALSANTDVLLGTEGSSTAGTLDLGGTKQTVNSIGLSSGNSGTTNNVITGGTNSLLTVSSTTTNSTFDGNIAGALALTKAGAGTTLTLTQLNTSYGAVVVSGGVLALNASGQALSSTSVTVNTGGTLKFQQAGEVSSQTTVDVEGGTFDIGAFATLIDHLVLNGGTVTGSGALSSTTDFLLYAGTVNAELTGASGLDKLGSGTVTLNNSNSYQDHTSVNGGTLVVTTDHALGNDNVVVTVQSGATLDLKNVAFSTNNPLNLAGTLSTSSGTSSFGSLITLQGNSTVSVAGTQLTLSGGFTDGGRNVGYTKTGSGTLILNGDSNYGGHTGISAGTVILGTANALPLNSIIDMTGSTAVLQLNGNSVTVAGITGSAGTVNNFGAFADFTVNNTANVTYNGTFTGALGLFKQGTGVLTLGGQSTYTGSTWVQSGTLQLAGGANRLPTGTNLILGDDGRNSSGIFDLGGQNQQLAALDALTTTSRVINTAGGAAPILTLNVAAGTTAVFTGILGQAGNDSFGIQKLGLGTLVLSNVNTYTGITTISAGIVKVSSNTALGSTGSGSGTVVANGGTLQVSGGITLTEPLTISGGGAAGTTGALENLSDNNTLTGGLTLSGNAKVSVDAGSTLNFQGPVNGSGGLALDIGTNGTASFLSGVGATTPLSSFTTTGLGTLNLAGSITVAGNVSIGTITSLAGDVTINSTAGITFTANSTIDTDPGGSAHNLTLNADTDQTNNDGTIVLAGAVGFLYRPNSVAFGATTDSIHLDNADFHTVNGATFSAPVVLGTNIVIDTTNGAAIFQSTVTGGGFSLKTPHDAEFDGSVTGLSSLEVDGKAKLAAPIISSSGNQLYKGAVTLGADTDIETTSGTVTFSSTVDGGFGLTVNAAHPTSGAVTFSGAVGNGTRLASLTAKGDSIQAAGIIKTSGNISLASQNLTLLGGAIDAGAGTVTIKVNQDGIGSESFTQTAASSITTTNATAAAIDIEVGGTGNVYLGKLTAGGGAGVVTVNAGGSVFDNNNGAGNITAGGTVLKAGAGVGTLASPIKTNVTNLVGQGGTGGFYVDNGTTALTIGGIPGASGISANGDVVLKGGSMNLLDNLSSLSSVQLFSSGAITQDPLSIITSPKLGVQATSASFNGSNLVDEVAANITGAGNSFNFMVDHDLAVGTVGTLTGITTTGGGGVHLTSNLGSLNINQRVLAPGGLVELTAQSGQANENGSGFVQADTLKTTTGAGTTLVGPNAVSFFQATNGGGTVKLNNTIALTITSISSGGNVDVTNSAQMNVNGPVNAGGDLLLTTTSGAAMILNADVTNQSSGMTLTASGQLNQKTGTIKSGGLVKLISQGADIVQGDTAKITAANVQTTSLHGANLAGQNTIQKFAASNTGAGDIVLNNLGDLEIGKINQTGGALIVTNTGLLTTADILTASGAVSFTTTGTTSDIVIGDKLTAGGKVTLKSPRNVITKGAVKSQGADLSGQIVDLKGNYDAGSGDLKVHTSVELYLEGTAYNGGNIFFNIDPVTTPLTDNRATIIATNPALTTLTANSAFTVGFQQKFLSFGSLTIQAGTATIGDLAAFNALTVSAGSIKLLDRPANGLAKGTAIDRGISIVGRTINFSGSMSFAGTGNGVASFATADGAPVAPRIAGTTFYRDPNFDADFPTFTGLPSGGFTNVPALTTFPNMPIAGGIVDSQVVAVLAGVLPDQPVPDAAAEAQISAATANKLLSLGVNARDADDEEKKDLLRKRALFKQLVLKQGASDSEYKVVVNRITSSQVVAVLKKYDQIFGPNQEAKSAIEDIFRQTYSRYIEETSATDASGFGAYLSSHASKDPQSAEAMRVISQFRDLFAEIGKLGLTSKEMKISEHVLGRSLTVEGMTSSDFLALVGVGQMVKSPTDPAKLPATEPSALPSGPGAMPVSAPAAAPASAPSFQLLPPAKKGPDFTQPPPEYFQEDLPPLPPVNSGNGYLGASTQH